MQNFYLKSVIILALFNITTLLSAQNAKAQVWDPELNQYVSEKTVNKERELRYTPEGEDFVVINGNEKFNRALYGTHTGFRVETGDVPEFALYLPRMGGNLSFSIGNKKETKALNNAKLIESRYRAGSRIYSITDPLLKNGNIKLTVLAMSRTEGMIIKLETSRIPSNIELSWIFGGAADKRFSREGDLGVDPDDCFDLKPEYCKGNEYSIERNSFSLLFGAKKDRKLIGTFPESSHLSLTATPTLKGTLSLKNKATYYFAIQIPDNGSKNTIEQLPRLFDQSESDRAKIASQLKLQLPILI